MGAIVSCANKTEDMKMQCYEVLIEETCYCDANLCNGAVPAYKGALYAITVSMVVLLFNKM